MITDKILKKELVSSKELAAKVGYGYDYISRLCRDGKVVGAKIGNVWFVDEASLNKFIAKQKSLKAERSRSLSEERKAEFAGDDSVERGWTSFVRKAAEKVDARISAKGVVAVAGALLALGTFQYTVQQGNIFSVALESQTAAVSLSSIAENLGDAFSSAAVRVQNSFVSLSKRVPFFPEVATPIATEDNNVEAAANVEVKIVERSVSELIPLATTRRIVPNLLDAAVLEINADTTISRSLSVSGATTLSSALTVRGATTLGTLRVAGQATFTERMRALGGVDTENTDINAGTGRVFASNLVNGITAGDNITITGTLQNPIISARRSGGGGGSSGLTSVGVSVPGFLSVSGSPLTSNGTITIDYAGTALPVANGGTGSTTPYGILVGSTTSLTTLEIGAGLSFDGTTLTNTGTGGGVGTVTSVQIDGDTTGLTFSGGPIINSGTITLGGTLGVANGGTGWANIQSGALLYGNGAGAMATTTEGTSGHVLAYLNGVPTWTATTTAGSGLTYTGAAFNLDMGSANVWTGLQTFQNGFLSFASSTIGNGTQAGGLTVSGGATTTGAAYFGGTARISDTFTLSSITTCSGNRALQTDASGNVSCGPIASLGVSTAGGWSTDSVGLVYLATSTDHVMVNGVLASSTPYAKFTAISEDAASTTVALVAASSQTANILDIYNNTGALGTVINASGWLGLGTTTPGTIFAIGTSATDYINLDNTATSTFGHSIDLKDGCFAINGTCLVNGGGGVNSIALDGFGALRTGAISFATSSAAVNNDWGITDDGAGLFTFNLPTADTTTRGLMSATDFTTFNNKISSTSLSATGPLAYDSGTGVFSLGIVPVTNGGTGWGAVQSGALLFGNGTGALATTTQGTGGYVLAWNNGEPQWVATSSISNGVNLLAATYPLLTTGATGDITILTDLATTSIRQTYGSNWIGETIFATSSLAINNDWGITDNGSGTFTFNLPDASVSDRGLLTSTDWNNFNNKASFAWPFTVNTGYVSTTTTLGFLDGLFSTASSTFTASTYFSSLSAGGAAIGQGGFLYSAATTTAGTGLTYSGNAFNVATSSLYSGSTGQFPYFSGTNTITATSSIYLATNGYVGIGSTTPGTLLSLGSGVTDYINLHNTATSTFGHGISIMTGSLNISELDCSALQNGGKLTVGVDGYVICSVDNGGAGAGVSTYLELTDTPSSYDFAGAIQYANAGKTALTQSANFVFDGTKLITPYASTTALTVSGTASSTDLIVSNVPGALILTNASGLAGAYGGATTCTGLSQLVQSINADGTVNCASSGAGTGGGSVTSIATNNGITGGTITGAGTIGLATINAGVLGAVTDGTVPTSLATSTLFGTGTGGYVLAWNNGEPQWVATSSISNGVNLLVATYPLLTTGATGDITISTDLATTSIRQTYGSNWIGETIFATSSLAINNNWGITDNGSGTFTFNIPDASASDRGLLTSTDWNNFNSKASFAWPFTPTSYGVSTTTTIGLLNGFLSTASSTVANLFNISSTTLGSSMAVFQDGSGAGVNRLVFTPDADEYLSNADSPFFTFRTSSGAASSTSLYLAGSTSSYIEMSTQANNTYIDLWSETGDKNINLSTNGNSYIDSTGNFGIGSTTPWRTLSVHGSSDLGTNALAGSFTATSTTATSTFAGFIDVNGTGSNATSTFASNLWVKGTLQTGTGSMFMNDGGITSSDGNLVLARSGVSYLNGGNVGIGTTTPGTLLSLGNGTDAINFSNTATSTFSFGLNIKDGCFAINGDCLSLAGLGGLSSVSADYPITGSGTSGDPLVLAFGTSTSNTWGGTQTFGRIDVASSTLGSSISIIEDHLGSPSEPMVVFTPDPTAYSNSSSNQPFFQFITNSGVASSSQLFMTGNNGSYLDAKSSASNTYVDLWSETGSKQIYFATNGNSYIDSTGNFGIGTTTPWRTLSVHGSSDLGTNALAGSFTATSTTATSTFAGFIDVNGTGSNATSTFASNLWVKGTLQTGTGSMFMNDGGITSSDGNLVLARSGVSYLNGGNVGIGTTSPYARLSVVGQVVGSHFTATTTSTNTFPNLLSTNATTTSQYITGRTSELLRTDSSGQVLGATIGSGLSFDGTTLSASGGGSPFPFTSATNFGINTSATTTPLWGQAGLFASSSSAYPTLAVSQSGAGAAATFMGGNVGISNASPSAKLDIVGVGGAASGWKLNNSFDAASAYFASDVDNAPFYITYGGTGAAEIELTSTGNVILAQGTGLVGVGTTSPWGKLSVTNTGSGPSFIVEDDTSPDSTPFIVDASGKVGIGTASPTAALTFAAGSTLNSLGALTINSGAATALTIDSGTTGNIDIGTGTDAKTINIGTGGTGVKTIAIGGSAANVIGIGNTQLAGSISLGAAMTTGTINIGGTGAQSGTINIANGTGAAHTVNIAASGGADANTINIGIANAPNAITIGGGGGSHILDIGAAKTAGNISIGSSMTGSIITIGNTNTLNLRGAAVAITAASSLNVNSGQLYLTQSTGNISLGLAEDGGERLQVVGNIVSKGTKWVSRQVSLNVDFNSITYGNGMFVGVGADGRVAYSPDGISWTTNASPNANLDWTSVTYGNGLFVAVASVTSGNAGNVMYSSDGINWTLNGTVSNSARKWQDVTYGNGTFVAVANNGSATTVMTSPDGIDWTVGTNGAISGWSGVVYGNGLFVEVSTDGVIYTSPTGVTWTSRLSNGRVWKDVTYGNGLFVAVEDNYQASTVGQVVTSEDGLTWTSRTVPSAESWKDVTYGNGLFVAIATDRGGSSEQLMTSPDGINWINRDPGINNGSWSSIAYGNGVFVAGDVSIGSVMSSGKSDYIAQQNNNIYQGGMTLQGLATGVTTGSLCLSSAGVVYFNTGSNNCISSTINSKQEVASSTLGLEALMQLDPVSYEYKPELKILGNRLGFIAEEVAIVDPRLASYGIDGKPNGLDDFAIMNLTVSAIQELNVRSVTFASTTDMRLEALEDRLAALEDGSVSSGSSTGSVSGFSTSSSTLIDQLFGTVTASTTEPTAYLASVIAEIPSDAVQAISDGMVAGKSYLTNFVAVRVTAVRGYFEEIFSKKVHAEIICLKKTDGSEVCVNGDQLDALVGGMASSPLPSEPAASSGTTSTNQPPSDTTTSATDPEPAPQTPSTDTPPEPTPPVEPAVIETAPEPTPPVEPAVIETAPEPTPPVEPVVIETAPEPTPPVEPVVIETAPEPVSEELVETATEASDPSADTSTEPALD